MPLCVCSFCTRSFGKSAVASSKLFSSLGIKLPRTCLGYWLFWRHVPHHQVCKVCCTVFFFFSLSLLGEFGYHAAGFACWPEFFVCGVARTLRVIQFPPGYSAVAPPLARRLLSCCFLLPVHIFDRPRWRSYCHPRIRWNFLSWLKKLQLDRTEQFTRYGIVV